MIMIHPQLKHYGIATAAIIAAILLSLLLVPLIKSNFLILLVVAVIFSAWYGNRKISIAAISLSILTSIYIFSYHLNTFGLAETGQLLLFLSVATLFIYLIEKHKRNEDRIRKSENDYKIAVDQASDAIFIFDRIGRFVEVNSRACQMLGYTKEELLQLTVRNLIPTEDMAVAPLRFEELEQGHTIHSIRRVQRKNGTCLTLELSSKMLSDGRFESIARDHAEYSLERLEESSASSFNSVIDYLPLSTQLFSIDGHCVRSSESWLDMWRIPKERLETYNIFNDQQFLNKGLMPLIERAFNGESITIPPIFYDPSALDGKGVPRWTQIHLYPIKDRDGNMIEVALIMEDATEIKRAEDVQRFFSEVNNVLASALDYQTTLNSIAKLAVPALADWCIVNMIEGKQTRLAAGLAEDNVKNDALHELKRRSIDWNSFYPSITAIRTGKTLNIPNLSIELLVNTASDPRQLELIKLLAPERAVAVPLIARGQTLGAITFARSETNIDYDTKDITLAEELARCAALAIDNARLYHEAKDAERNKDESLALLNTLLVTAPVGFAFIDRELRYVHINDAYAAMSGISPEEHRGLTVRDVTPDLASQLEPLQQQVLETGQPIVNVEICGETRAIPGQKRYWLFNYYPVTSQDGYIPGFGVVVTEITERKRVEEERTELLLREQQARKEAETASRLKDEFLATVSHELRTPLTSILGWAKLLQSGDFDHDVSIQALESIERNARAQASLIDDLLDVSRIITGKLRLDVCLVELTPIVEGAIENVIPAAKAKNIELKTELDEKSCFLTGDPNRLQQIVWNLVSNAIKFTNQGGTVEIKLEYDDATAEIMVSDNGVGIPADFLPHVFDRFRQADSSITRAYGGLGLGLAIVRHLVELHGGSVQAKSDGVGKGATFVVQLPLTVEEKEPVATKSEKSSIEMISTGIEPAPAKMIHF
jgi:PAS domain S-box-containing protein